MCEENSNLQLLGLMAAKMDLRNSSKERISWPIEQLSASQGLYSTKYYLITYERFIKRTGPPALHEDINAGLYDWRKLSWTKNYTVTSLGLTTNTVVHCTKQLLPQYTKWMMHVQNCLSTVISSVTTSAHSIRRNVSQDPTLLHMYQSPMYSARVNQRATCKIGSLVGPHFIFHTISITLIELVATSTHTGQSEPSLWMKTKSNFYKGSRKTAHNNIPLISSKTVQSCWYK